MEEKTDEELDKMSAFARFFYRARVRRIKKIRKQEMRRQRKPAMADKLDKGYNAGMARALAILDVVYEEYKKNPTITKQRLYLETIEEIFATSTGSTLIDKNLENVLPIKDLSNGGKQ